MIDIQKIVQIAGQNHVQIELLERKARKPWSCETCGAEISPGTKYWNRVVRIYNYPVDQPYLSEHYCMNHPPEPIMQKIRERQHALPERNLSKV